LSALRSAKAAGFEARTVYGAVVRVLGAMGWQEEMVKVVEEMCKEGFATPKTFADALRYNMVLTSYPLISFPSSGRSLL
jgi:pentatricopeptide repeat protein